MWIEKTGGTEVLQGAPRGLFEKHKVILSAGEAEPAGAKGYTFNSFKIELAKRAITQALTTVARMT